MVESIFFARSRINRTNGNSFAVPRIAGAYALLANADPYATVETKTTALKDANTRTSTYRARIGGITKTYTARYVQKTDMTEAIRLLGILNQPLNDNEAIAAGELNIQNDFEYGTYYGLSDHPYTLNIDFAELRPVVSTSSFQNEALTNKTNFTLDGRRDVRLSFDGIFENSSFTKRFNLYINNQFIVGFINYPTNRPTHRSYIINRRLFRNGNNKIELRPSSDKNPWGIRSLKMEFLPSIDLQVGVKDTNEYGYEKKPDSRYTGLRANFSIPNADLDYQLSMIGWDIDVADETRVFVNGTFLGHLTASTTGSSEYSPKDTFLIPHTILRSGINHVELVQREIDSSWNGFQDAKWAVKDLEVQVAKPDLLVSSFSITDNFLKKDIPFTVTTIVKNNGVGRSNIGTLNYYLSNDSDIGSTDIFMDSANLNNLNALQKITINKNIVTSEINKNKYIGVCIADDPTELTVANNCSKGIKLNNTTVAPIIMLLLDDD